MGRHTTADYCRHNYTRILGGRAGQNGQQAGRSSGPPCDTVVRRNRILDEQTGSPVTLPPTEPADLRTVCIEVLSRFERTSCSS